MRRPARPRRAGVRSGRRLALAPHGDQVRPGQRGVAAHLVRCVRLAPPLRWSAMAVLTILASPHLLSYDLLLLTIPLILIAAWAVEHYDNALRPSITIVLVLLYFAPFSGNLFAMLTHVQVSVVVMALL